MQINIYFYDLTKPKQYFILKKLGLKSEKDMNWDCLPMFVMEIEPEVGEPDESIQETKKG